MIGIVCRPCLVLIGYRKRVVPVPAPLLYPFCPAGVGSVAATTSPARCPSCGEID
jgi:hypothetical protein